MGYDQLNSIIRLENISHAYGGNKSVLSDISLEIPEKSFYSILGPSGCGKSTLLKISASMLKPQAGHVYVKDRIVHSPDPERIIVFQDDNQLFPWMTVRENISFPLRLLGRSIIDKRSEILEKQVYLDGYTDYYPSQLSGGMRKRTIIARALSSEPEILLLDEPFSSLDIQTRITLHKLIYSIWEKTGITVVFVTHDIDEALTLSSDIAVMNSSGSFTSIFRNSFAGSFGEMSIDFFTRRKELMNMIESPEKI